MGQNITDFDPNWVFPDYRPVAAFKSLRFALFVFKSYLFVFIILLGQFRSKSQRDWWILLQQKSRFAHQNMAVVYLWCKAFSETTIIWAPSFSFSMHNDSNIWKYNKANLRDLIAATGLVISNWIQIVNFSARVTAKFDGWPSKTIGHLFYATSSFVHHFVAIGEFKLELQSRNAQSGSNSTIFRAMQPWNLTDDLAKQ